MAQKKRAATTSRPRKKPAARGGASRRSNHKQQPRIWQWYGAGVISGVLMSLLFYLGTLPPENGTASPGVAGSAGTDDINSQAEEPRFDFYTMLENQNIDIEVDPADIENSRGSQVSEVYLLQTGSFRQLADADRRRAELLLIGLEPTVEETNGDNGRWYRVYVGPFNSRSKMAKARALAAEQDIDTLLLKRKPN